MKRVRKVGPRERIALLALLACDNARIMPCVDAPTFLRCQRRLRHSAEAADAEYRPEPECGAVSPASRWCAGAGAVLGHRSASPTSTPGPRA